MPVPTARFVSAADLERLLGLLTASNPQEGLFGPNSVSWKVNRESALFLAAGRAALLQLAHPWVAQAIAEHSTTLHDPIGRFHQTFRVMFTISFGSTEQAQAAARRLHRRHQAIRGRMPETAACFPQGSPYEANMVGVLAWVYATLMDSSVLGYGLALPALTPGEREQYYAEGRRTAGLFGIAPESLPPNWQQFQDYFESMLASAVLGVSRTTQGIAQELQSGAGSWLRLPYWYRALTAELLPPRLRAAFQLPYGEREQRSAARAKRWLPRIYRALPPPFRFVGPYLEAQAKLAGRSRPSLGVRLSNRLWAGESSLLSSRR
jgi:uncharacterized protein (DUF2236 family)